MVAIDDGFADAKASQEILKNKFAVVYEYSTLESLPDFEITYPLVWNGFKKWMANRNSQAKRLIDSQLVRNQEFESTCIADVNKNSNWVERKIEKSYKIRVNKMAPKHLRKFEESFAQYEKFFEEWKKKEENRFVELDVDISDQSESLEPNQVDRLMDTSDTFKGIAEELALKFRQIIERLEELSRIIFDYDLIVSNRYKDLAAKAELSFGSQIEELLDFSDCYRGLAGSNDPNNKVIKVFDDIDSLCAYIKTI